MENKASSKFKLSKYKNISKLHPLLVVVVIAAIGTTYLALSHAAPGVQVFGSDPGYNASQQLWYRSAVLQLGNSTLCSAQSSVDITIPLQGSHNYAVSYNRVGQPFLEIDNGADYSISGYTPTHDEGGSPQTYYYMPGIQYCPVANPDPSGTNVWAGTINIDSVAPNVSFSSTSTTTESSSITVSGGASDSGSGLASVRVNGTPATLSSNNWIATVPLAIGANTLTATAIDYVGNSAASGAITITRVTAPSSPSPPSGGGGSSGSSNSNSNSNSSSSSTSKNKGSTSSSSNSTGTSTTQPAGLNSTSSATNNSSSAGSANNSSSNDIFPGTSSNVPVGVSTTLTSYDNVVSMIFPAGTFDTNALCSINQGNSSNVPITASGKVIGPYNVFCSDLNGNTLATFKKDVTVDIQLNSTNSKYVAYISSTTWTKIPSTQQAKTLSFKLTKATLFAAATAKPGHLSIIIINIVGFIILLIIIGAVILVRHRNTYAYANDES